MDQFMHAAFSLAVGRIIPIRILRPAPGNDAGRGRIQASDRSWTAVKTRAALVSSVGHVIAMAGAGDDTGGDHALALAVFGLLVSMPLIVRGRRLVTKLADRLAANVTPGGMPPGWIAGTMTATATGTHSRLPAQAPGLPPGQPGALPASPAGGQFDKRRAAAAAS